jgi:hypothetical protein
VGKSLRRGQSCLNCGVQITSNYCPDCGQENVNNRVSVRYLFQDIIDEFLKLDSKLFATLWALILRPGLLTREYNAGRRVRFIPPFKLYFTISAIYFLAFATLHTGDALRREMENRAASVDFRSSLRKMPTAVGNGQQQEVEAKAVRMEGKFRKAMAQMTLWLTTNLGTILFCMVPVTAIILTLLYWRSGRLYVEHLVFAVHNQCFQFLVSLAFLFVPSYPFKNATVMVFTPIYTFLAMRRVYGQGLLKTALKSLTLTASYFAVLAMIGIVVMIYLLV